MCVRQDFSGARFELTRTINSGSAIGMHTVRLLEQDVPHFHAAIELGVCVSGSGESMTDGVRQPFSAGSFQIVFPFQVHWNISKPGAAGVWNWVFLDYSEIAKLTGNNAWLVSQLTGRITLFGIIAPEKDAELTQYFRVLVTTLRENSPHRLEKIYSLLTLLLLRLAELSQGERRPAADVPRQYQELIRMLNGIHNALQRQQQISVEELARVCAVPPSTCRRIFQRILHLSPKQYITDCAIRQAMLCLCETKKSVIEIAEWAGFPEISTFNRAFRRKVGCTPGEYRKRASGSSAEGSG